MARTSAVGQPHPDVVETLVVLEADVQARSAPRPQGIHTRTVAFNSTGVIDIVAGQQRAHPVAARQGNLHAARKLVAGVAT